MTASELKTALEGTGLPVAYHAFKKPQSLPFIVYIESGTDNVSADGVVYQKASGWAVELYTENRDLTAEGKVEEALAPYFWNSTEIYLEDEKCFETIYTMKEYGG